jgi:hypothetical protein
MTTLIVPELAREAVTALARAAERRRSDEVSAADAAAVLELALDQAEVLQRLWQSLLTELDKAAEMGRARAEAEAVAGFCDSWTALVRVALDWAESAGRREQKAVAGVGEIVEAGEEVKAVRAACQKLIDATDAPRPPADPKTSEEVKARAARGEDQSQDLAAVIARLQASEKL